MNAITLFLPILVVALCACSPEADLAIRNVRLFDGDTTREGVTMYLKDQKIDQITTGPPFRKARQEINARGKTIIPGLINAHVHLAGRELLSETLSSGVLTVLDLFGTAEKAQRLRRVGQTPRYSYYYASGPGATVSGGHGTQYGVPVPTVDHPQQAAQFVEDRVAEQADYIKIIVEAGTPVLPLPTLSDSTVKLLVAEAQKRGKKAVVHVSTKADALRAGAVGASGIAHMWSRGDLAMTPQELRVFSMRPFFVIATLLVLSKASIHYPTLVTLPLSTIKSEIRRLHDAGVKVLAGTDCPNLGINCSDDLLEEMLLLEQCGLPPVEVIKAATSYPATCFGLPQGGFVREGRSADFLLIDGNPTKDLADIRRIERIWKAGAEVAHRNNR